MTSSPVNITWTDARAGALASTHWGENGYLVTVTSQAEQDFFIGAFGAADGWLGGSDELLEGDWRWMDGPEAGQLFWQGTNRGTANGYTDWHPSNPRNSGNEDYLHVLGGGHGGLWNDAVAPRGYYIEFAAGIAPGGVPEPSAWALLILGFGVVGAAARRRREPTYLPR